MIYGMISSASSTRSPLTINSNKADLEKIRECGIILPPDPPKPKPGLKAGAQVIIALIRMRKMALAWAEKLELHDTLYNALQAQRAAAAAAARSENRSSSSSKRHGAEQSARRSQQGNGERRATGRSSGDRRASSSRHQDTSILVKRLSREAR